MNEDNVKGIDNIQIVTFLEVEKNIPYKEIKTVEKKGRKRLVFIYDSTQLTDDILNEFPRSWTARIIDTYRSLIKIMPK